jgi:hypothetical protein
MPTLMYLSYICEPKFAASFPLLCASLLHTVAPVATGKSELEDGELADGYMEQELI